MRISLISNEKYFISIDLQTDHTRRDAYFIVDAGEFGISGSYKRYQYTSGKAAFRKYDELSKLLFDKYGVK